LRRIAPQRAGVEEIRKTADGVIESRQ